MQKGTDANELKPPNPAVKLEWMNEQLRSIDGRYSHLERRECWFQVSPDAIDEVRSGRSSQSEAIYSNMSRAPAIDNRRTFFFFFWSVTASPLKVTTKTLGLLLSSITEPG